MLFQYDSSYQAIGKGKGGGKYLDRDGIENDSPLKLLVLALLYMYI